MGGAFGGSSSEGDISNFRDRIVSMQHKWETPAICGVIAKLGFDPKKFPFEYPKLDEPTLMELLEARDKQADIDTKYYNISTMSSDEIRESRMRGDKFDFESYILDDVERKAMEAERIEEENSGEVDNPDKGDNEE